MNCPTFCERVYVFTGESNARTTGHQHRKGISFLSRDNLDYEKNAFYFAQKHFE
jgi:hypothetical protein